MARVIARRAIAKSNSPPRAVLHDNRPPGQVTYCSKTDGRPLHPGFAFGYAVANPCNPDIASSYRYPPTSLSKYAATSGSSGGISSGLPPSRRDMVAW